MRFTFCPDCGAKLIGRAIGDDGLVPYCGHCDRQHSGDGSISEERFVCVSGYIMTNETAEQAAVREVTEELGLKPVKVRLVATYAYQKKQMLMTGFLAELPEGDFSLSDELIAAQWFDEAGVGVRLAGSSVAKLLFKDIKGAKL